MADILILSLWIGLSAASTTILLRYAPTMQKRVQEGQKPIACDVCMSLWLTLAAAFAAIANGTPWQIVWQAWLPSYAVAKWTVGRLMDPTHFPSFELDEEPKEAVASMLAEWDEEHPPGAETSESSDEPDAIDISGDATQVLDDRTTIRPRRREKDDVMFHARHLPSPTPISEGIIAKVNEEEEELPHDS